MPVLGSWKTPWGRWEGQRPLRSWEGQEWGCWWEGNAGGWGQGRRAGLRVGQQKGPPRSCPATALYSMWARLAGLTAPSPLGKDRGCCPEACPAGDEVQPRSASWASAPALIMGTEASRSGFCTRIKIQDPEQWALLGGRLFLEPRSLH